LRFKDGQAVANKHSVVAMAIYMAGNWFKQVNINNKISFKKEGLPSCSECFNFL